MIYINKIKTLFLLVSLIFSLVVTSKENIGGRNNQNNNNPLGGLAIDCAQASASAELSINNVRTTILNGGDMWWDLFSAKYEVPNVAGTNQVSKHSIFAGALWIGGVDAGGNLKLAAMTYRQSGVDFWPGPLDTTNATTNSGRCDAYDRMYQVYGDEIIEHVDNINNGNISFIENIRNWPGNGNGINEPKFLAPFFDSDANGIYDPNAGDYPVLTNDCKGFVKPAEDNGPDDQPDQMIWWVYNDRGNIHTESNAQSIGLEIRTTAFAFRSNDEINNMTFYTSEVVNRGFTDLEETYFGQWVDPDLGNFSDDYVGCDVGLSLGFCYNGDDNDEGVLGYGLNPPSVGVDFFEGPKVDTTIDGQTVQRELGLSKFVYYNNDFDPVTGNPQFPIHYYNYLQGKWKNGDCIKFGGDGTAGNDCTDYMFPGDTDPNHPGQNWTERTSGNAPADRRFLQSSGPFTLKPGSVNRVTVGVVWARASSGGALGSLNQLKIASEKAQVLFNNCFDILDGPDAPELEISELNQQIVFSFYNTESDRVEKYEEDVIDADGETITYKFQGYRVFQVKDGSVNGADLKDPTLARELFQVDIEDDIIQLVNKPFDADVSERIPQLEIEGENKGISHSFVIEEDLFATGSNRALVNYRDYFYIVVSYAAYPGHPDTEYLEGRKIQTFRATPRKTDALFGGSQLNSAYGSGPEIVRVDGIGNGSRELELTEETIQEILANGKADKPKYMAGMGPINIKTIDPTKIPVADFELYLVEDTTINNQITLARHRDSALFGYKTRWVMVKKGEDGSPNDTLFSDTTIDQDREKIITFKAIGKEEYDWGMAVSIKDVLPPGSPFNETDNGYISTDAEVIWQDPARQWLSAIPDDDGVPVFDWIRSGEQGRGNTFDITIHDYRDGNQPYDRFQAYEKIWDGRIAPYFLASRNPDASGAGERSFTQIQGVGYDALGTNASANKSLEYIRSVDIVFTPDKEKWTQCVVLEMGEIAENNEGGVAKFGLRDHSSIDINGSEIPGEKGRSWFPGYAIDVESGERLNIIIGEDSYQEEDNGRDMKWNPTDSRGTLGSNYYQFGGRHYIYIMGNYADTTNQRILQLEGVPNITAMDPTAYDGGKKYHELLTGDEFNSYSAANKRTRMGHLMYQCMWTIPAFMSSGFEMLEDENGMPVPPTELKFRLRVSTPYRHNRFNDAFVNNNLPFFEFSTKNIAPTFGVEEGKKGVDDINIVPNPYYAYSAYYENSPVDNLVKITNLPEKCDISIYTLDGQLVRRYKKDDDQAYISWDLKNQAQVPIASGFYIIHVDAFDLGEKILKWTGIMRELDLDSF